jgi:hypothetical protein
MKSVIFSKIDVIKEYYVRCNNPDTERQVLMFPFMDGSEEINLNIQ